MLPDRGLSGPHLARLLGSWRSSGPAYASLARALRLLVLDGRLPLRTRLPGERELAEALGVSRTTATAAYAALREEGFLASRRGAGSWTRLARRSGRGGRGAGRRRHRRHRSQLRGLRGARRRAARARWRPPRPSSRVTCPGPGYDAAGLPVLRARDRLASDGSRRAHGARAGARDRGRPARVDAPAARARRPGRPCSHRAPDLPGGAGCRARHRRPSRPRADAAGRLGPGHARGDVPPGRAAGRVPDRRSPEPDRADAAGGRLARGSSPSPAPRGRRW